MKCEKIQVGRTYELNAPGEENYLVFVVLAERDGLVPVSWWKILVLQSGPWWSESKPGVVCEWMKGAKIFTRVKRID